MRIDYSLLIDNLKKLPPLSAPLQQTLVLLNNDQSDWDTISKVMLKDSVLTGRVLQIANSSFYGLHRQVKDIEIACTMLGSETLRSLIYTLILLSKFRHGNEHSVVDYNSLWMHSLRVACLAKIFARKIDSHPATTFTAAVFHCMDLIIQDYFFPQVLEERLSEYYRENKYSNSEKIYSMIDSEYWGLTAALLDYWQFPVAIVSVFQQEISVMDNSIKNIILDSSKIIKSGKNNNIKVNVDDFKENAFFLKTEMTHMDVQECVDESEKLYLEMVGWVMSE